MADDNDEKAYIRIEREASVYKYIAKISGEPPRQITKKQYNAINKALGKHDWKQSDEEEAKSINRIIRDNLLSNEN